MAMASKRSSQHHAEPEAACHVAQFRIVFFRRGDGARLERHAADRAVARLARTISGCMGQVYSVLVSATGNSGSSAMPQVGQGPGFGSRTSGHMGQT